MNKGFDHTKYNKQHNPLLAMSETISFKLNGEDKTLALDGERTLLWVLRTDYGLTGTKYGCGLGLCGSCTVLINNKPVRSCQVTADFANGKEVVTIEGLAKSGNLNPVQKAFIDHEALQCGFCTPGMIMNATGLLHKNPEPTRSEIIEAMEENLCRCGSYNKIVNAIESAAATVKGGEAL
jgi:aerobic-type carbon monoxide dehydrogenase small subunit (CoxS/CutS family)